MMRYTDQVLPSPLSASGGYRSTSPTPLPVDSHRITSAHDSRISLTPLWEYVVRTKTLPEGLDLDVFFQAIQERLRNPEREVRQHALRVLADFIPLINITQVDEKMSSIMADLVANLGHIGPAVRKGAIDCLRVYLNYSHNSDEILKDLVYKGIEKANETKTKTNVVIGLIIAVPFFIQKATMSSILYVIRTLFEKMVQMTYQEVSLKSLARIKDAVGETNFEEYVKMSGTSGTKKNFDLLCEVYNVNGRNLNESTSDTSPYRNKTYWSDLNQNIIEEEEWKSDTDVILRKSNGEIIEDRVILETEIKLNSGPAITMQVHEESRQSIADVIDSDDDGRNRMGIVKVLSDESEEDYEPRRTPRRVRFGGEIVKLRTPDSDSNQPSDVDNDPTITITPRDDGTVDKPLIEIHYTDTKTTRSKTIARSQIPISHIRRQKTVQSEPSSPNRSEIKTNRKRLMSRSSPNLYKSHIFGEKIPSSRISRIPRRKGASEQREKGEKRTTTIQIKFTDFREKSKTKQTNKAVPKTEQPEKLSKSHLTPPTKVTDKPNKTSDLEKTKEEPESPPVIPHQPIEIFHNLTRSPERKPTPQISEPPQTLITETEKVKDEPKPQENTEVEEKKTDETSSAVKTAQKVNSKTNEDRQLVTADKILLGHRETKPVRSRNIQTADQVAKTVINQNGIVQVTNNTYNSFHVCSSTLNEALRNYVDSPIPTNDNGECLTCSSSGSDNVIFESSWEDAGVIDSSTISNLNCKDDWRTRLRGLEDLSKILQNQNSLEALESKAASFLHLLFSCEQHSRLQAAAEDALKISLSNMKIETIKGRLNQIVTSLCKMGSPAGVRLSILLMRRISVEEFLDQLLKNTILGAKSSKIREGALQILMTISRIFPSTEVNVPRATEAVTPLLNDRKKRVRRASLETIAALAQLGTPAVVLNIITRISSNYPEKEQLLRVVRTRLSRKQLPAVDLNGSVRYSTPSGESELEWISIGSATTSPQGDKPDSDSPKNENQEEEVKMTEPAGNESITSSALEENQAKSEQKANYWKTNARHFDESKGEVVRYQEGSESDWSRDSGDAKEDLKAQNLQIWAVDPWTLSTPVKLSAANGTLRPIYLVEREQQFQTNSETSNSPTSLKEKDDHPGYRPTVRGRSFSPPKRQPEFGGKNGEPERFIAFNGYVKTGTLRKSSSSDHIGIGRKSLSGSTSSSNSGASTRNTGWYNRSFKSGIPIPLSSDSRVRFKTRQLVEATKGPISIPTQFYRTKSPSPQTTPERAILSQRTILVRQPFSSGSESSEFYTPPAEPHLATPITKPLEDTVLQSPRPSESFIEVDSPRYHNENFTIIDDTPPNVLDQNKTFVRDETDSSDGDRAHNIEISVKENALERQETQQTEDEFDSEEMYDVPPPKVYARDRQQTYDVENSPYQQKDNTNSSLDDFDMYKNTRSLSNRLLSKSEANLQKTNEIPRKSVSSAPTLNDSLNHLRYESYDESPATSAMTSLPGSVAEFLPEQEETPPFVQQKAPVTKETPAPVKSSSKTPRTKTLCRKNSVRMSRKEVPIFPDALRPFPKPKEGVSETLEQLESNDWEATMRGLQGVVRLTRYHPEMVETNIHSICVSLGKQIRNLRSQVARAACLAASELFSNHRRALEMELEELAVPLLHRTADTNRFLRSDANAALDKMCLNMAPPRVVHVLATKGGGHQNAIVRCSAARLLCSLTNRLGCEKTFQLPKETRDKILYSGANMLMEGNLETRKHAKMMYGNLSRHSHFNKALMDAVPVCTMRHIQKTLQNLF